MIRIHKRGRLAVEADMFVIEIIPERKEANGDPVMAAVMMILFIIVYDVAEFRVHSSQSVSTGTHYRFPQVDKCRAFCPDCEIIITGHEVLDVSHN